MLLSKLSIGPLISFSGPKSNPVLYHTFNYYVSLITIHQKQFLSLYLSQLDTSQGHWSAICENVSQNRFVSDFFVIKLKLCIVGKSTMKMTVCPCV